MRTSDENKSLRLVGSSNAGKRKTKREDAHQSTPGVEAYYQHVEYYAQRIRDSSEGAEGVESQETALADSYDQRHGNDLYHAQEQLRLAEKRIESLKFELEQLREQVHTDPMTGAFNRRGLSTVFLREAARADRNENALCAVAVDLDDFSCINYQYGYQFGDAVLMHFSRIARTSLRPSDVVARYGGEEFIILLLDITPASAEWVMQRLRTNFSKKPLLDMEGLPVTVTFSAGIALRRFHENQNTVIERAYEVLYLAKRSGKDSMRVAADSDKL
ncbi:GGDEF domain-containing protein [Nitrosomonas sp. ANs5]|uniref:GGDEF domain-containing protein n=1 Tax=Nitrosomonas sp. ANs5 TaxID=3423941 RepID=UPI003D33262B